MSIKYYKVLEIKDGQAIAMMTISNIGFAFFFADTESWTYYDGIYHDDTEEYKEEVPLKWAKLNGIKKYEHKRERDNES